MMQGFSDSAVQENHLGSCLNVGQKPHLQRLSHRWVPKIFILTCFRWSMIKLREVLAQSPLPTPAPRHGNGEGQGWDVGRGYYTVSMDPWVQIFSLKAPSTVTKKVWSINKGSSYSKVQEPAWEPFFSSPTPSCLPALPPYFSSTWKSAALARLQRHSAQRTPES